MRDPPVIELARKAETAVTYRGTVRRGVVVLEGGVSLAEGTTVEVHPVSPIEPATWEGHGVYRNSRVAGGETCVENTRVPVWTLVAYRRLGRRDEDLLRDFPSLTAADLQAAWAYAAQNPAEIDAAVAAQRQD